MAVCDGDGGFGFIPAEDARKKARDDFTIWCEIQGIQQAILKAISQCQYSVIVDDNTPMTHTQPIMAIEVTNGGQNYYPVEAGATFVHPSGTGATGTVIVEGSTITHVLVTDGGTGYDPIPVTVDGTTEGNGDAILQAIVYDGAIIEVSVVVAGTGYVVGAKLPVSHPFGIGADIEVASVGSVGNILAVRIVRSGTGYDTVHTQVIINHPSGAGFEGIVKINTSQVESVEITRGGLGYQPLLPQVIITDETGQGAQALATVEDGVITKIDVVTGGYGYSENPVVTILPAQSSGGFGATAEARTGKNSDCSCCVEGHCPKYSPYDYYAVWSGADDNRMIQDQLEAVLSFFKQLGYTIYINTNPQTGMTIQWNIMW